MYFIRTSRLLDGFSFLALTIFNQKFPVCNAGFETIDQIWSLGMHSASWGIAMAHKQ
jgi:hypothetical protein